MPQLVPFYFINQVVNKNIILITFIFISFVFKLLLLMGFNFDFFSNESLLLYILSKYILLGYERLNIFLSEKISKLKVLISIHYSLVVMDHQKMGLIIHAFAFLILRLPFLMEPNVDFLFIFTIFNILSMEHAFDFFSNESLLNEDSSILNMGESSSQGSSGQNPNNGQGSSQGPSGQNPKYLLNKDRYPWPNRNPIPTPDYHIITTGSITDTERLANYLEEHERAGARFVNRAGIRFTTGNVVLGTYNEEMSRIARWVREDFHNVFYTPGPDNTRIDDNLIWSLRRMRQNVPADFR